MYISGENIVMKPYTPVDAYAVMPTAGVVISGGSGGESTVTKGVNFLWVYNPVNPAGPPSGFTGMGWFADTEHSPIWYSIQSKTATLEDILNGFAGGGRVNLNDVFQNWQDYVEEQGALGRDVVMLFQEEFGFHSGCWTNLT